MERRRERKGVGKGGINEGKKERDSEAH